MDNIFSNLLKDNELWIITNNDGKTGIFSKFISNKIVGEAYAFITNRKFIILVNSLDFDNINTNTNCIMFNSVNIQEKFNDILNKLNYPKKIFLNYSQNELIDEIGHGEYLKLNKLLNKSYKNHVILSSENLLLDICQFNTNEDIEKFKISSKRANQILTKAFKQIKINMTEKEINKLVISIFNKKPSYFKNLGIVKEELSWNGTNPIVLIGKNFTKGGHSTPSDTPLLRGNTIYFDFGVKLTFENGKSYASDIQRMGYALKQDENFAPKFVKDVFNTLKQAILLGKEKASTKVKGYEVDEIVRNYIISNGYPEYNHGTGHSVGEFAHNYGTRLSKKIYKESNLNLKYNGVYTIEPRIMIENGGSIEEMIVVKENFSEFVSPIQKKLFLIK